MRRCPHSHCTECCLSSFLASTCPESGIRCRTFAAPPPRSHRCLRSCYRHQLILGRIGRRSPRTAICRALGPDTVLTGQQSLGLLARIGKCPFAVMKRPIYASS